MCVYIYIYMCVCVIVSCVCACIYLLEAKEHDRFDKFLYRHDFLVTLHPQITSFCS